MIAIGAISAFIAVLTGAFGAHGLEKILDERSLQIWHTAVTYQMTHSLALIALGLFQGAKITCNGWIFMIGIFLFSGSLYALAITGIKILGAITPMGGLAFLIGWAMFAYKAWREQRSKQQSYPH